MITNQLLTDFNRFLVEYTGLYFPKEKWPQLKKALTEAAKEFGCETPGKCIKWLISSHLTKQQIEILASYLTVGETYFFRGKKTFDVLETIILPEIIGKKRHGEKRLRVWSAACSTGEEVYSIAIILDKKKEELTDFYIQIMGTDINMKALNTAREGIYSEWSFRENPPWFKDIYFTLQEKNKYKIRTNIRSKVTFDYFNLVTDGCPSILNNTTGMDIIFCRNVLMYFETEIAKKVVKNLFNCLIPGGWLVVSPTDVFNVSCPGLIRADIPDVPVYRRIPIESHMDESNIILTTLQTPHEPHEPHEPHDSLAADTIPSPGSHIEFPAEKIHKNLDSYYKEALELFQQGYYVKAVKVLESLLSHPQASKVKNSVAMDYLKDRAFELLCIAHVNQGKLETAEKWCLEAINSAKLNPHFRYLMAIIQLEQGNSESATESLKQSLYIDPDFIPALFTLGYIAQQKKNYIEANRYFDYCLSLLNKLDPGEKIMELDGWLTAGRLTEMIIVMKKKGPSYE